MKRRLLLAGITLMLFSVTAFAQTASLKIGYADIDYVLEQMPEYKEIQNEFNTFQGQLQKQYKAKIDEYQAKLAEYQQNAAGMIDAMRADKEKELVQLEERIQEFQQNIQTELQRKQSELFQPLYVKIGNSIEKVAEENSFDYIFSAKVGAIDVLLYGKDEYDVSDLILKNMGITPQPSN